MESGVFGITGDHPQQIQQKNHCQALRFKKVSGYTHLEFTTFPYIAMLHC